MSKGLIKGIEMRLHVICLLLVLTGLMISSSGCLVVAAGAGAAGTMAYMRGDLEAEEAYKLDTVYAASREAMKQLQLSVLEGKTEQDALSATIVARDASDKRVTIKLKAQGEQMTKLSIRIGTFGDQTKSHMIYNRIRDNLKATAAPQLSAPNQPAPPASEPPDAQATPSPGNQPPSPMPQAPPVPPAETPPAPK